jgi:hypothetical protein
MFEEHEIIHDLIKKGYATQEDFENGFAEWEDDWSFKNNLKQKGLTEQEIKEKIEKKYDLGLDYINVNGEYHYLGFYWKCIDDNETGLEFKNEIEKRVKKIFNKEKKCMTYEEAWYPC